MGDYVESSVKRIKASPWNTMAQKKRIRKEMEGNTSHGEREPGMWDGKPRGEGHPLWGVGSRWRDSLSTVSHSLGYALGKGNLEATWVFCNLRRKKTRCERTGQTVRGSQVRKRIKPQPPPWHEWITCAYIVR